MTWFVLATCSALLSAASAVIQKRILFRLNALEFSFSVSLVLVLISSFIPLAADIASVSIPTLSIIAGKSILGATAFLLVMLSLQHNQISSALPLLGLTPAATAILSLLILGEGLKQWEWAGIGLMIAGSYLLERTGSGNFFQPIVRVVSSKKYYYVFGAVGLFAVSSVFDRLLVGGMKTDPLVVLFYQHVVYVVAFAAALLLRQTSFREILLKGTDQALLILSVAALTLAYRFTQLEATALAPVALVLAVKRTSILYASFFGGRLFSEDRLKMKLAGALLIVAAGFIILRNVG